MPFTKQGENDYTGPSGRHFNLKQVRLYYAHGQKFPGQQGFAGGGVVASMGNKGHMSKDCAYAEGGQVLGRSADFMKAPDRFRQQGPDGKFSAPPSVEKTSDEWGKGSSTPTGSVSAPPAKGKQLKAVKPRQ
jgi:hypothetical protein